MVTLIIVACAFAILLRYRVQGTQACLYWGVKIAPPEYLAIYPRGMQDAISPKSWNAPFFIALAGTIGTIIYSFFVHGWNGIGVALAALIASSIAGAVFIPKPGSRHFLDAILRHLSTRSADYAKQGDSERAAAAKALYEKLFHAAFGEQQQAIDETASNDEESTAEAIVNAYGKTIEYLAPPPGGVADANKLPFPKERIKAALLLMLKHSTPEQRPSLLAGYMMLADFQPGVGDKDVGIDFSQTDAANMSQEELVAFATKMTEGSAEREKWQAIATKERAQLEHDLQALGLGV
jgi:hypothetical protein